MESTNRLSDSGGQRPVTCVIMDGVLSFALPVLEEMGIPYIYFRTVGACSFWANFCIQEIIDAGEVPLKGKDEDKLTNWKKKEMDLMVTSVPGMEGFLRRRDLPGFCRVSDVNDPGFQTIKTETRKSTKAVALILNTFEDLEGPILDQIRKHIPNLYSVGPLHTHLKARLAVKTSDSSRASGSFWEEDHSCVTWLDSQPAKSVIYVSFGSVTLLTRNELLEFWYGLVNSGQRFLWVMRPDSIIGNDGESRIPVELEEGTKERGYLVGWAPQEEVLFHPAVCAFLTHSGWNSTLESVMVGMPMICWPYFADQMINSRFVSEVWKLGLDMKDSCDRMIIEKMVRDIMVTRRDEFLQMANHMANLGEKAISEGGSSYYGNNRGCNKEKLILNFQLKLNGHVNSMLKLAELLCLYNLHVTMLLSEFTHGRLLLHANAQSHFAHYPGFRFVTMPDGLPEDHPRAGERILEILLSLKETGRPEFRRLMESTDRLSDGSARRPVTCVIMDGVLSFSIPVLEEMGIPYIYFRTVSSCSFWAYFCIQEIIDAGEVPLKGKDEDKLTYWKKEEMDLMVSSVPGMEGFLRRRDLPGFLRANDVNDPGFQSIKIETRKSTKARALILNTFEDLEGPVLDQIRKHVPNLYSVGPLHSHLKARLAAITSEFSRASGSFWEEDRSCLTWLDSQAAKTVIYVSFGSVTLLTRNELLEFWYGLVNSGQRFLWVMRPDSIIGNDGESRIPLELEKGTKERGYLVGWAPQEEVLAHPAVCAFFTHSGWNSTLESIVVEMPMICWPYFADQAINSRFVSEVWKLGLDMKDSCDRMIIEKMVRDIMVMRRDEFLQRTDHMANLARKAISEGGSSYTNLDRLIEFLRAMIV
ncbi:UDP-glycosyltransferase 85A2 [Abeliophyllum distichum]|uniref:7-deoxyloganetic acid glucosyltransferase n=1 Tax=Abeliophyllum distichum TaxID=126358 RepID=A0ABD1VW79_9LAMI